MKKMTKSALLAAALIALPVAHASADTLPGWYGTLGAGMDFQLNTDKDTKGIPAFKFNQPGFDALGSIGYQYDSGLRFEGEAFHSYAVVKNNDGNLSNTDLFANALYDFNMNSMLTPYVGAGIGADFVDANNIGNATVGHVKDSSTKLGYQGIAGVSAQLDNDWSVAADYRYIASLDPKFKNSTGGHERFDNASNNILFSLRYNFCAPAATPVATEAPMMHQKMAAKPAVAPIPQTFQVFFDFDKSDLTPEAKRIVASAAQAYQGGKFVRIVVTGHTDTKGTAAYNKKLSDRRAASVKAEFERLGVQSSVVVTQGVGKNGLLVPTNDGVREAQNRRAEIVLGQK